MPSLIFAACLGLSGCVSPATLGKVAQVIADPTTPVGRQREQPSSLTITLYAETGANRNQQGQSTPVDVRIFQLTDETRFQTTDFLTLSGDPQAALGTALVAARDTQLEPGKSRVVEEWDVKGEARYLGVAVGFRDIDRANWRSVTPIRATGETYRLLVVVHRGSVTIQVHR